MNRKMWLRGTFLLAILLLLSTILSACWPFPDPSPSQSPTPTPNNVLATCLGSLISPKGPDDFKNLWQNIKDIFSHDEHIGAEARVMNNAKSTNSSRQDGCIQAINNQLNQNSQQLTPKVGIYQVTDTTMQYTYTDSRTINNCIDQNMWYTGVMPVLLLVGTFDNNQFKTYIDPKYSNATGDAPLSSDGLQSPQTDQDKIAQAIYNNVDFSQYFKNQTFTVQLPEHSTVQVQLTLTLNVKAGWGAVGQSGQALDWIYNYGFQLPNNPTAQLTQTANPCG